MNNPFFFHDKFTGPNKYVNPAGKALGHFASLIPGQPPKGGMSLAGLGGLLQDQLRWLFRGLSRNPLVLFLFGASVLLIPETLWAHDGELLKDEISKVEKLFTGGYMRLGLLAVCGFAAIYGIVKQSGWIFASGVLGCIFAYFMKDWILKTFTAVI